MSVESRDYPDVNDVEDKSGGRRQKDFDALLDLAETLQEKCDRDGQRVLVYRLVETVLTVFLCVVSVALLSHTGAIPLVYSAVGIGCMLSGGLGLFCVEYLLHKIAVWTDRDRRALSEVVELLRSTERSVAKDVGFSALERARLRIQLSRFDI